MFLWQLTWGCPIHMQLVETFYRKCIFCVNWTHVREIMHKKNERQFFKKKKKRFKAFSLSVSVCLSVCLSVPFSFECQTCWVLFQMESHIIGNCNSYKYIHIKKCTLWPLFEKGCCLWLRRTDSRLMNPKINHWIGPCYTMTLTRNGWAVAECQQVKTA